MDRTPEDMLHRRGPDELAHDTTFDKIARWVALVVAGFGVLFYLFLVLTELDRLVDDFWEDGLVLGLCYFGLTLAGVLRTFKPSLPEALHVAAALANVLMGYVVVMFLAGLFVGFIDDGAEFIPILMTLAYIVVLRAIHVQDHFVAPRWLITVAALAAALNVILPAVLRQRAGGLSDLNAAATFSGAIQIITILIWGALVVVGFRRIWQAMGGDEPWSAHQMQGRPTSVAVIAWIQIALAAVGIVAVIGVYVSIGGGTMLRLVLAIILAGGLQVVWSVGMLRGHNWGRLLFLWGAPGSFLIGVFRGGPSTPALINFASYLVFLYFLTRPITVAYFRGDRTAQSLKASETP